MGLISKSVSNLMMLEFEFKGTGGGVSAIVIQQSTHLHRGPPGPFGEQVIEKTWPNPTVLDLIKKTAHAS